MRAGQIGYFETRFPVIPASAALLSAWIGWQVLVSGLTIDLNEPIVLLALGFIVILLNGMGTTDRMAAEPEASGPRRFGLANSVTLSRGVATALIAGLIGTTLPEHAVWLAMAVALACLALDGVDGWIARRTGTSSPLGARLDMETDALMILVLSVLAFQLDKAGPWVLLIGLMRYGFVAVGWLLPALKAPLPDSFRRKVICVLQGVALAIALAPAVPTWFATPLLAFCLAALVWSFAKDCRWLISHG